MTKKKAIYTIDGKPASLRDVKSRAKDATLKEALCLRDLPRKTVWLKNSKFGDSNEGVMGFQEATEISHY